jgi:medium-chain acyl-[acyl-carrier-protein] hydrolase
MTAVPGEPVAPWARRCSDPLAAPAMRLLCFPYAGAGASAYRDWRLPAELATEVWAVQPPGRESRRSEPPPDDLDALIGAYARQLAPLLDRPFAFFGHSLGALVAFELARRLRRDRARQPVQLFVSALRAPHLPPSRSPVSPLTDEDLLRRLLDMAGESPSAIRDPELLMLMAPVTRADCGLLDRYAYRPEPALDLPITGFGAVDDCEVDLTEIAAWDGHTTGEYRLRTFVGGHLFVREHAEAITAEIASGLVITASGVAG